MTYPVVACSRTNFYPAVFPNIVDAARDVY
jgi:hypothetical protein